MSVLIVSLSSIRLPKESWSSSPSPFEGISAYVYQVNARQGPSVQRYRTCCLRWDYGFAQVMVMAHSPR